jgi:quinoprotein dehydrogenase-associated probable ABC transporter substrate-binding protein
MRAPQHSWASGRVGRWLAVACAAAAPCLASAADSAPRELAVCADPSNLPYSNERQEGFENRIASLIASDLKATLHYTWNMQRRSFLRRTLNAGVCDLVIGLPAGLQGVAASRPYYASSYVFVTAKDRGIHLTGFDDPALRTLRIGLQALGAEGSNTPPASALARRGIRDHITGYPMWGEEDDETPQGRIIDAVASGEIDVAIVWGPFAGYFAKRHGDRLQVALADGDPSQPALAFRYDMALGVRRGDEVFLGELQQVLDRRQPEIQAILRDYGIPLAAAGAPDGVRSSGMLGLVTDRLGM